jgi:MSHA biogenesis protein MshI
MRRMGFFSKTKKLDGWMAIALQPDGICTAYVERSPQARYSVRLATFHPSRSASDAPLLERIAKESQADRYRWTSLLSLGEYQILSVDAPNVPPDELKTAIRWRLKDLLDYHIDDATIDVLDVPVEKNSPARAHSMYAVAARNNLIEQRQALFGDAKLPISVIDIPEMAQRNVSSLLERDGQGVAMLSFQSGSGLLTITYSGELYLSRQFDVALSQVSQSDVEQLTACYERIALELQRSLDHFDRQYHVIPVSRLVLAPLEDLAAGLQEHLVANLDIPVETLDLEDILDLSQVPELKSPTAQQRFFMAVGAAMRHEVKAL